MSRPFYQPDFVSLPHGCSESIKAAFERSSTRSTAMLNQAAIANGETSAVVVTMDERARCEALTAADNRKDTTCGGAEVGFMAAVFFGFLSVIAWLSYSLRQQMVAGVEISPETWVGAAAILMGMGLIVTVPVFELLNSVISDPDQRNPYGSLAASRLGATGMIVGDKAIYAVDPHDSWRLESLSVRTIYFDAIGAVKYTRFGDGTSKVSVFNRYGKRVASIMDPVSDVSTVDELVLRINRRICP